MTETPAINEFIAAAEAALAATDPENEVMALVQGAAWARIYGITLSSSGLTVALALDDEGKSRAIIATTALIGIRNIPKENVTIGFRSGS
jgi:hypothetical protein